ncbi:MAG: TIGR04219 family outer membrane beta-barrel protein [Gammaproteobacteria bacterium]|nr:TIGR04219 family outer membrane beta-barrel protein [Gammaproteobacteria bacterium]
MKKQLLSMSLLVSLAAASFSANAAMILGIDAGYYVWQPTISGSVDNGATDVAAAGYTDGTNGVAYLAFEHPVPFVPNVKLQMTEMAADGSAGNAIDLAHTDSVFYYEILDNFVSVDVGLVARAFNGSFNIGGTPSVMDDTVYMLYTAAEVIIPFAGLSVGMEINEDMSFDDNAISDIKMRLRYEILSGLGVELGQRTVTMSLKESAPLTKDLKFDGTYIAVTYTF